MVPGLLLTLVLWASCLPCLGKEEGSPAAPAQPRVRCRAFRYPVAVDCMWTVPLAANGTRPTSFISTYRLGATAQGESWPCHQSTPKSTHCNISDILIFSLVPYVLNVTAMYPGQTSRSTFLPFVPEHIIKPDPPERVRLSPLPGHRLGVHWEAPHTWPHPEIFSLKYWIRYKRHGAARFRKVGPTEATSFTIRATKPHARYCIQVSAQDLTNSGHPSDWSVPAVLTGALDGQHRPSTHLKGLCP